MLEMILSCVLLTVLTGVLALAWMRGARGWTYTSKLSSRMAQLAVLRHRIEKELSGSTVLSVEVQPSVLSFASALGLRNSLEAGEFFRLPQRAEPRWRKYVVYYWAAAEQRIYQREVQIPSGNPAEWQPLRLSQADLGSGLRSLPTYASGGRSLVEAVSDFQVRLENNLVRLEFESSEAVHGSNVRKLRATSLTAVRN